MIELANDTPGGAAGVGGGAETRVETGAADGPPTDPITAVLGQYAAIFEDLQRTRKSMGLRRDAATKTALGPVADTAATVEAALLKSEQRVSRQLARRLREHILWPWLEPFKGLAGPLTARLIAIIGNPHRFPGQPCATGHLGPPRSECGWSVDDEPCAAPMLPPRPGSGVRSVWHYLGVHGRLPMRRKGVQADWNPAGRTLLLQPDGLADQIVRHRTPIYRDVLDAHKERLIRERGVAQGSGGESRPGPAPASPGTDTATERDGTDGPGSSSGGTEVVGETAQTDGSPAGAEGAEHSAVSGSFPGPLRPFQIHQRAKTIAVKKFVGDLLTEWKRRAA